VSSVRWGEGIGRGRRDKGDGLYMDGYSVLAYKMDGWVGDRGALK
jgi:hypothetical protein